MISKVHSVISMNKHPIYNIEIHIHRTHVLYTSHTTKHTHHTSWLLTEHRRLKIMWAHSLHVDVLVMSNKPCWNLPDDVVWEGLWTSQQPADSAKDMGGAGQGRWLWVLSASSHKPFWFPQIVLDMEVCRKDCNVTGWAVPRVTVCGCSRAQKEILSARDHPLLPGLGLT